MRSLAVPPDTTLDAARVQAGMLRRFPRERRLAMTFSTSRFASTLHREVPAMTQEEFVLAVADRLIRAGIPFMVVGSLASSTHGQPRYTADADLVVDPTAEQLETFLADLGEEFYTSPAGARDALGRRGMFNVLAEGWKADLIVRKDRPFSIAEFGRRRAVTLSGRELPFASPEDVILSKLEWDRLSPSERQVRDAIQVAVVQGGALDRDHLRRWAADLGVTAKLEELLAEADRVIGSPELS